MHWSGLNSDLKHVLQLYYGGGGANLSKIKQINETLKNGKK